MIAKRLITLVLTLILSLSLAACDDGKDTPPASGETPEVAQEPEATPNAPEATPDATAVSDDAETSMANEIIGIWYLISIEEEGSTLNPVSAGVEMTLTFNEDKTMSMQSTIEDTQEGSWVIEDGKLIATLDGVTSTYELNDGVLTLYEGGSILYFSREQSSAIKAPPIRTDVTLEDFAGDWIAVAAGIDGLMEPLEAAGVVESSISITGAELTFSILLETNPGTTSKSVYTGSLEGSMLAVIGENPITLEEEMLVLFIHEDGTLSNPISENTKLFYERAG